MKQKKTGSNKRISNPDSVSDDEYKTDKPLLLTVNEFKKLSTEYLKHINAIQNATIHNINALPKRTKNIKVDVDVWETLNGMKEGDQTFNDVIARLIGAGTQAKGNKNILAIKYKRKRAFFTTNFEKEQIGCEFEYNDSKGIKKDFALDIQIKKVFLGRKSLSPHDFFGVDNIHKHYSKHYLILYLKSLAVALQKEFRISFNGNANDYEDLVLWRKLYYEYGLSEESFASDIEDPLRLSEDEPVPDNWKRSIKASLANNIASEWGRSSLKVNR